MGFDIVSFQLRSCESKEMGLCGERRVSETLVEVPRRGRKVRQGRSANKCHSHIRLDVTLSHNSYLIKPYLISIYHVTFISSTV